MIKKFYASSIESVDVQGLERALIAKGLSSTQAVEIFGKRSGMLFKTLADHAKEQADLEKQIKGVKPGFAAKEAAVQMGGLAGAKERFTGSWHNLLTKLATDNEKWLTPLYNAGTSLENKFIETSGPIKDLAVAAVGAAAALVTLGGAKLAGNAFRGEALFGGGLGLGSLGGLLVPSAPAIVAGMGAGLLAGSTPLNAGEDELARQRKLNLGGAHWLGNQPPEAGKFSPSPGGLGAFRLARQTSAFASTSALILACSPSRFLKR